VVEHVAAAYVLVVALTLLFVPLFGFGILDCGGLGVELDDGVADLGLEHDFHPGRHEVHLLVFLKPLQLTQRVLRGHEHVHPVRLFVVALQLQNKLTQVFVDDLLHQFGGQLLLLHFEFDFGDFLLD